jgi:hypothetical protein
MFVVLQINCIACVKCNLARKQWKTPTEMRLYKNIIKYFPPFFIFRSRVKLNLLMLRFQMRLLYTTLMIDEY